MPDFIPSIRYLAVSLQGVHVGGDSPTATLLDDGRVLLIPKLQKNAVVWDPRTDSFEETSPLLEPRFIHEATLTADGRVIVSGGYNLGDSLNSIEVFDPISMAFQQLGNLENRRDSFKVIPLPGSRFLVPGGADLGVAIQGVEYIDLKRFSVSRAAKLNIGRDSYSATVLEDGRIMIAGGVIYYDEEGNNKHQYLKSVEFFTEY